MTIVRVLAVLIAVVTMGVVTGGALAAVAPIHQTVPPVPTLSYTISVPGPGAPALFAPYITTGHVGLVQVHFVNSDSFHHSYFLRGTGLMVNLFPQQSLTMVVYLSHPGVYAWVNVIPSPGVPSGATVGILVVN